MMKFQSKTHLQKTVCTEGELLTPIRSRQPCYFVRLVSWPEYVVLALTD